MKKILVFLAVVGLALSAHADFQWGSSYYFYDSNGTAGNWLIHNTSSSVGVFVQLIRDVNNDGAAAISATGTGVSDDDVVYAVAWFGADGVSVPPAYHGMWWSPNTGQTMTAGPTEDGYSFYARVWDSPAATWNGLSTAIDPSAMYYQGPVWTYDNDTPLQNYDMAPTAEGTTTGFGLGYVTTSQVVPEPTTLMLGLVGLVLLRLFRVKKA